MSAATAPPSPRAIRRQRLDDLRPARSAGPSPRSHRSRSSLLSSQEAIGLVHNLSSNIGAVTMIAITCQEALEWLLVVVFAAGARGIATRGRDRSFDEAAASCDLCRRRARVGFPEFDRD